MKTDTDKHREVIRQMNKLTPTQRVERESFTETNQANAIVTKKFALQLAIELESVRKELEIRSVTCDKAMANYEAAHAVNVDLRQQLLGKTLECEEARKWMSGEEYQSDFQTAKEMRLAINGYRINITDLQAERDELRKIADELAESVYRVGTTMCGCDNCNAYIKAQYALTTYENLPHKKTTKPTE